LEGGQLVWGADGRSQEKGLNNQRSAGGGGSAEESAKKEGWHRGEGVWDGIEKSLLSLGKAGVETHASVERKKTRLETMT